ncbi:MAG TPA: hypothetical protein VGS57_09440 [Thermoanaerobaculia bacterium]|jgi:hypothetical protein|nr:hypothetical protein [Thermoanaerobaculia bacterium]
MKSVRTALAAAVVWLVPSLAGAQSKAPPGIPTLGLPGAIVLGAVLGAAGLVINRRRDK